MIITLKITLVCGMHCDGKWTANIELDESSTLVELHGAIQDAVDFDDDHMFCFYRSRTERSQNREYFDDENGLLFRKTLKDMFPLPPKQSLFYLFDWGDNWIFKVARTRSRPHEPVQGITYPRVAGESGIRPVQYPEYDGEFED